MAAKKANSLLGCIYSSLASKLEEVIVLYDSALLSPHIEFCINFHVLTIKRVSGKKWKRFREVDQKIETKYP